MRIAARYQDLPALRSLAETVCYIADFRIDEVCDLTIAVDEVAAALVRHAVEGVVLACDFDYDVARMHVTVATDVLAPDMVDEHSFGWYVVSAITDFLSATVGPYDSLVGGYRVAVEFSRSRSEIDDD